jgi:hypothetical protein
VSQASDRKDGVGIVLPGPFILPTGRGRGRWGWPSAAGGADAARTRPGATAVLSEPDPDVAPDAELPPSSTIADYLGPILVQHGGRDGYVAPDNAGIFKGALAAARHLDFTIILYPELGRARSWTPGRCTDTVENIDAEPLTDLLNWLYNHVVRR